MENQGKKDQEKEEKSEKGIPKILLMGKCGVGKTSMRSIIFANQAPKDTMILGYTSEVAESRLRFMGNLSFNLFDCGGQEEFVRQYFETKKESIFSNVEVLIFVVEAISLNTKNNVKDNIKDVNYFEDCIKALEEYSPSAKVFVFIHKMDLVDDEQRKYIFNKRKEELQAKAGKFSVSYYQTSIWEHSLYTAWTSITASLTKNIEEIQKSLKNFASACDAEEVILFEKNSFLVSSSYSSKKMRDEQRFEKISHIIKKFKLSCMSINSRFRSMVIRTNFFMCFLDEFTPSTYIMVICNKKVTLELLKLNIALCLKSFKDKLGEA